MIKYARACTATEGTVNDEARCRTAGVSIHTLARWQRKPGFSRWLHSQVQRHLEETVWEVWVGVLRLARQGNLQAAKLILERFDPQAGRLSSSAPGDFQALAELADGGELRSGK